MTTGSVLAQFTITLSQAVSEQVAVEWHTADGTALAGVDYAAAKGTVLFAPGETAKTVDILVYGRAVGSEDRSFFVEMLPPVNAILGASIGECIIHVDTTGSTPVTQIIVPTGPQGPEGKSAYQTWLDLGNTGSEQDFIDSLSPSAEEIAEEVAPLLDVGKSPVTAKDTDTLSKPDSMTVEVLARRVAYVGAAKIATVLLADGDNLIGQSDLTGDPVDVSSVGLYPRIMRGTAVLSPQWSVEADGRLLIKNAVAGDVLYVCQYDIASGQAVTRLSREGLRRSYAEAGYTLVAGSFEVGGTVASATDVLLYEADGKAYNWNGTYPDGGKTVPVDSTPASAGGVGPALWDDKSASVLGVLLNVSLVPVAAGDKVYHPEGPITQYPGAPDAEMTGPGAYTTPAGTFAADLLRFNPAKTSIFYCPDDYARAASGINYPAPFLAGFERPARSQVISAGSKLDDESREVRRNVVFGPLIGADPIDWNLVDAFGSNPMAYAGRVERTTAIGSEVMVWFGAPDQNWLRTYQHDWWRKPAGMPFEPGEAGWDSGGLETLFPGIGARIAAFTDYATTTAEAGFCYGAGRDALNRIVKGKRNIASGYGTAQNLFVGDYNADYGALAGRNAVFSSYCTRIGDQAGMNSNDTEYLVSLGYASGRELQDSDGATTVGAFAAADVLSAKKAVVIGNNAGRGHPVPLDDFLVISNAPSADRAPLMAGNFPAALAGINVMPEAVRAKWHVKNSSSGSSISHAGGVLSEGTGTAYFVAETNATGEGQYRFGDPDSGSAGMIAYSHASNSMTFRVNDTNQLRIENNVLRPWETNTMLCGRAAYAFSGGFTQAAFTVTSDERHKTKPIEVSDAILDAWDEVEWLQYKFLDRISAKGEDARWHFGVIAQRVHEAFKRHGIDGFELGLLCYDKWESEPAIYRDLTQDEIDSGAYPSVQTRILVTPELEAGDKWGIVYEEALALEAKLQRRKYERLLARVEALEGKA